MFRPLHLALALALLLIPTAAGAQASCPVADRYTLNWSAQPQGSQGTGQRVYNATDGAGRQQPVTVSYDGATSRMVALNFGSVGTFTPPYIGVINTGGLTAPNLSTLTIGAIFPGYASNIDDATRTVGANFAFAVPLRDITFTVLDIDYTANQYRDWVKITGRTATGTVLTPAITSPYGGRNNSTNPGQTAPATTVIGPYTASVPNFPADQIVGNSAASTETQNYGNVTAVFSQPVVSVQVRYGNGPAAYMGGTAGQQAIAIHNLVFCTMPQIAVTKTSAMVAVAAGDPNRFAIPGALVDYTITVTNTGGSPVDLNSWTLTDTLPAQFTAFVGDIDPGVAGTQYYVFTPGTSGLTLADANVTLATNAAGPYTYVPVATFDPGIRAVRAQPQGTMAANSSFSIRFRGRIN